MKASVRWLNQLLGGEAQGADRVEALLTDAGFPIDARESVPGGDTRLEVEVTSNRGDCLSHIGLAREIAARTGRELRLPQIPSVTAAGPVTDAVRLQNNIPATCPRFTAHVIRGVKVGPSPSWLVTLLESVGQRSINTIVDVTNYINFLYGQPTHAFDLAKLAGRTLVVRMAREGEALTTLDGKARKLRSDEMVVADEHKAQSLAGVIGGADSEVGPDTRDVVLEAATWDPVSVRKAARRHQVRTDAGHRFERGVDARTIDDPARLAAALIADLGGGTLCTGMLDAGTPLPPPRQVRMRPQRCRDLLGVAVDDGEIESVLRSLSIGVERESPGMLRCRIPAFRLDLEREVDLIEEVARVHGLDRVPVLDRISISVRPPQTSETAARAMGHTLAGLGFYETVTFSFVTPGHAAPFLPAGHTTLAVDDDRRKLDGTLRPSSLAGLLQCRKANSDAGVASDCGTRLFEVSAVFSQDTAGKVVERRTLALLMDVHGVDKGKAASVEDRQRAVRLLRGALETVGEAMGGAGAVDIRPGSPRCAAFEPAASAHVAVAGEVVGQFGAITSEVQRLFGLDIPVVAAEVELAPLVALYPPRARVAALPAFPSIERDLSLIVDESVAWDSVHRLVANAGIDRLESTAFIGTYRGKQIGPGKKSVTLRMLFRDPSRTLRHEEVDPQVSAVVSLAGQQLGATLRT